MVDKPKDNSLDSEIAKRLDDLFGEGDESFDDEEPIEAKETAAEGNEAQEQPASSADEEIVDLTEVAAGKTAGERVPDDYPLAELKHSVLSIDWEITEEALADFLDQVESLKATYKNEKIISMFLQLLGSLGVYIQTNRGNAHPKTFKILSSVFSRLEDVVRSKDMPEAEKKKLLRTEMDKYKQLRSQVSKKKAAKVVRQEVIPAPKELESLIKTPQQKEAARPDRKTSEKAANKGPAANPSTPVAVANLADAVEELKKFIHSELSTLKQELKKLQKSK